MRRIVPPHLRGDHEGQLMHFTRVLPNGCWEYRGYLHPTTGYGQLGRNLFAHRLAWQVANRKPVPAGMVIDHICHNADPSCNDNQACRHRRCVNPDHLEPVASGVNVMRGKGFGPINAQKTHCPAGHPLWGANLYLRPDKKNARDCNTCRQAVSIARGNAGVWASKRRRVAQALAANPDASNNAIAVMCGVSGGLVSKVRHGIPGRSRINYLAEFGPGDFRMPTTTRRAA